ncbi:septum formation family protein [Homoserinimonas sp. A447]
MTFSLRFARPVALVSVLLASVALTGCSQVSAVVEQVLPERIGAHTLVVGECFNNTVSILTAEDAVVDVPRENCTLDHDNEAIASIQLDAEKFPGDDTVTLQSTADCLVEFEKFIGVPLAEAGTLTFDFFAPSAASWKLGDREVLCYVYDSAAQTTYSLKGKGAERAAAVVPVEGEPAGDS